MPNEPITVNQEILRHLVDVVWMTAHEDESVPATDWADEMIDRALREKPPLTGVDAIPEWKRKACQAILNQPPMDMSYLDAPG